MEKQVYLRVRCGLPQPDGVYEGYIEVTLDDRAPFELQFRLKNPDGEDLELRILRGNRVIVDLVGDASLATLERTQHMFVCAVAGPLQTAALHADTLTGANRVRLEQAVAELDAATGYAELAALDGVRLVATAETIAAFEQLLAA